MPHMVPGVCGDRGVRILYAAACKHSMAHAGQLRDDGQMQPEALRLRQLAISSLCSSHDAELSGCTASAALLLLASVVITCVQTMPPGFRARCIAWKKGCGRTTSDLADGS